MSTRGAVQVREVVMRVADLSFVSLLRRLWRDGRGGAAIEFGYIAPLLLLLLLGTIEMGRAIDMNRHFGMVTAALSDLVAREEYLGDTESESSTNLGHMMEAIEHMMKPYDASSLKFSVFQVRASPNNASVTRVDWAYSHNMHVPSECEVYALPAGLVEKGGSVIVVQSEYQFHPLFADFVPGITGDMTWTENSMHSPRNSCVDYVKGDNCSSLACP
jgi:Flp pilus assembly protein TadG